LPCYLFFNYAHDLGGLSGGNWLDNFSFNPISEAFILINQTLLRPPFSVLEVLIHEIGHTLGLAHTGTILNARAALFGSPNDTLGNGLIPTSATNIPTMFFTVDAFLDGAPLKPDDIAAVTLNYPEDNAGASFGAISGTVLDKNGEPLLGAAIIAYGISGGLEGVEIGIILGGNPDLANNLTGAYQIDFLPPGSYFVTLVPLRGDLESAFLLPELSVDGFFLFHSTNRNFAETFFDNTTDESQASIVTVTGGTVRTNVNFLNIPTNFGIPGGGNDPPGFAPIVLTGSFDGTGCQSTGPLTSANALAYLFIFFAPLFFVQWKKKTIRR